MNQLERFEKEQIAALTENSNIPAFRSGDTVKVNVKISEGANERIQTYEGVVIARRNAGVNSSFLVRKISYGSGVERRFKIYSPNIDSIEVVKHGIVRRAKLYYLRNRSGKSARIAERMTYNNKK
jgi:large subunit ribosomal protein L19